MHLFDIIWMHIGNDFKICIKYIMTKLFITSWPYKGAMLNVVWNCLLLLCIDKEKLWTCGHRSLWTFYIYGNENYPIQLVLCASWQIYFVFLLLFNKIRPLQFISTINMTCWIIYVGLKELSQFIYFVCCYLPPTWLFE